MVNEYMRLSGWSTDSEYVGSTVEWLSSGCVMLVSGLSFTGREPVAFEW